MIVGKYTDVKDSYKSLYESIHHAATHHHLHANIQLVAAESLDGTNIHWKKQGVNGVIIAGGFGERGFQGKLDAVRYAREQGIPCLGICLGMQAMVVEFARNVVGLKYASSTEMDPNTPYPVIDLMSDQQQVEEKGGTLRVGAYDCQLQPNTVIERAYNASMIQERHRHRWEFNSKYADVLQEHGLVLSGIEPTMGIVESVELHDHPWFVGVQFHPELKSVVPDAHPLFIAFIEAAKNLAS